MEKSLDDELKFRFNLVEENLKVIKNNISNAAQKVGKRLEDITLLAATKTVPTEVINHAISLGINCIGENRVQEMLSKYDNINLENCDMHFIGHLQTNKVKQVVGRVNMIESVDSIKLANEINKVSKDKGLKTKVLIEVNIGNDSAKSGVAPEELEDFIYTIDKIDSIEVCGLMTVPPICTNKNETRKIFSKLYKIFIDIRDKNVDNISMRYLSMGMSSDYTEAILEGANIVRIGSSLFGKRIYN